MPNPEQDPSAANNADEKIEAKRSGRSNSDDASVNAPSGLGFDGAFDNDGDAGASGDANSNGNVDGAEDADVGEEPSGNSNYEAPEADTGTEAENINGPVNGLSGSTGRSVDPGNESSSSSGKLPLFQLDPFSD